MTPERWLTKSDVNSLYYNAVAGAIDFATEAQASVHAPVAAKLISSHARSCGKTEIRILEIGANNCTFARALLGELRRLTVAGDASLARIDYLAVEYARASLEAAAARETEESKSRRFLRGPIYDPAAAVPQPTLVACVTKRGSPVTHLGLVHAEANQFVASNDQQFDVAILNELLDDMDGRAFYADASGRRYEFAARAAFEGAVWRVQVTAEATDDRALTAMPPSTLTWRSAESVELVTGITRLLAPQGMLVIHDYGFASAFPRLEEYEPMPRSVPSRALALLEFPPGSDQGFPRAFFRVFSNVDHRVVQITNDVNFAELASALTPDGTVVMLAHGNAMTNHPEFRAFQRGNGVFLSEFGLLTPGDHLPTVLARLAADQQQFLDSYIRDYMGGRQSIFTDLVFLKGGR